MQRVQLKKIFTMSKWTFYQIPRRRIENFILKCHFRSLFLQLWFQNSASQRKIIFSDPKARNWPWYRVSWSISGKKRYFHADLWYLRFKPLETSLFYSWHMQDFLHQVITSVPMNVLGLIAGIALVWKPFRRIFAGDITFRQIRIYANVRPNLSPGSIRKCLAWFFNNCYQCWLIPLGRSARKFYSRYLTLSRSRTWLCFTENREFSHTYWLRSWTKLVPKYLICNFLPTGHYFDRL